MLLPDDVGDFRCESCDFVTSSLFDLMEHHGVEYSWNVMLSKKYSFNLFSFLSQLNFYLEEELFEEAWEHIQSTALLFLNSSGGPKEFEAFLEEAEIYANMDAVMNQVEEILKETYNDKDKE